MSNEDSPWIEQFPGNKMWSNATLVNKGMGQGPIGYQPLLFRMVAIPISTEPKKKRRI